jgi:hypothetical protein
MFIAFAAKAIRRRGSRTLVKPAAPFGSAFWLWLPAPTQAPAPSMIRTPPRRTFGSCAIMSTPGSRFPAPQCMATSKPSAALRTCYCGGRVETGSSTEANYGRFYPGYARPTNRWVVRKRAGGDDLRTPGRIAQPLPNGASLENFNFKLITPALQGDAGVLQAPWWRRARLTDGASLPNGAGIYCIYERDADEPVYIGETSALLARSATHAARSWSLSEPWLAVLPLADGTPKYVLHELESDLLGWHFWRTGRAPVFQYRKARGAGENSA